MQPPELVLPLKPLSRSERQHRARRLSNCPRSISFCGRSAISKGCFDLASSATGAEVEGEARGLALCSHRYCPVCGPRLASEKAALLSKSLLVLDSEGWKVGMLTLTFPHYLNTSTDALASAIHKGIKAVGKVLGGYCNAAADAARAALAKLDAQKPRPDDHAARRAQLSETVRVNTLQWLAPSPEVTLGPNGLHPHYHVLLLCPPALQKEFFEGAKIEGYWRLLDLEAAVYAAWTPTVISALRAGTPRDLQELYRPADWVLGADALDRQRRLDALALDPKAKPSAVAGARRDLAAALQAAQPDSPERLALRARMCQAVRWSGAVAAAAHYTWGAANEVAGAAKRCDLWRALDHDATAPLWGRWVDSTKGRRLTRSTRGLIAWLEEVAETCPADVCPPAPEPPTVRIEAHAHPFVWRWARDNRLDSALKLAVSQGQEALARWLSQHLPPPLRPLVELRPDRPAPPSPDEPTDNLTLEAHAKIQRAAQDLPTVGYWVASSGQIAAETQPAPCPKKAAARAYVASRRKAATLAKDLRGVPASQITAHSRARLEAAVYDVADRAYGVV